MSKFLRYFWDRREPTESLDTVTPEEYFEQLSYPLGHHVPPETDPNIVYPNRRERAEKAFDVVLDTRKFEIEMYWKRATYFWAFIASTFVGYVALLDKELFFPAFLISCVGIILSFAWHFINLGSKAWQRHWEKHMDLLEDPFVGPLYKTVYPVKTYSVSKINEIVSCVFIIVWMILLVYCLHLQSVLDFFKPNTKVEWVFLPILFGTGLAVWSMHFGHGRGRFGRQNAAMHRRTFYYHSE